MDRSLTVSKGASPISIEVLQPPPNLLPRTLDEGGVRECIAEDPPIRLRQDSRIQKEDGAPVLPRAHKPTESLFEAKGSEGDQIGIKWAPSARFDGLHPRLDDRFGGNAKGDLLKYEPAERVPGDIDSLPERGRPKKDPTPRSNKVAEELSARGFAMDKDRPGSPGSIPKERRH
jgi:hypothetical protein